MSPWDPGLQPERTELSWRRTVLAATTGMALAARYLGEDHPVLGIVLPIVAIAVGLVLLRLSILRLQQVDRALWEGADRGRDPRDVPTLPGAGLLAAVAGAAGLAFVAGAVYVFSGWL